ncbi:MAG: hypothetical protein ABSG56_04945 [Bryobacteraceae bacterium]|jgi:hypothetical protein
MTRDIGKIAPLRGRQRQSFAQIGAPAHNYRDTVRFRHGGEVRLQQLREGQRVEVLDLSMAEEFGPPLDEYTEAAFWR